MPVNRDFDGHCYCKWRRRFNFQISQIKELLSVFYWSDIFLYADVVPKRDIANILTRLGVT